MYVNKSFKYRHKKTGCGKSNRTYAYPLLVDKYNLTSVPKSDLKRNKKIKCSRRFKQNFSNMRYGIYTMSSDPRVSPIAGG